MLALELGVAADVDLLELEAELPLQPGELLAGRPAAGVVGPFAPSQTMCALMRSAFSTVIACSSAHGASTSQSSSRSSSCGIGAAHARPASEPVRRLCASAARTSMPLGLWSAAVES